MVLNAKSLIVLMAVSFALLLPLVFVSERRPFMAHVVVSLHPYTFLLVVFSAALLVAKFSSMLGLEGLEAPRVDNVLSVANLIACGFYLCLAIGPFYGVKNAKGAIQAMVLALAVAAIVLGYRFALFLVTVYATWPLRRANPSSKTLLVQ